MEILSKLQIIRIIGVEQYNDFSAVRSSLYRVQMQNSENQNREEAVLPGQFHRDRLLIKRK